MDQAPESPPAQTSNFEFTGQAGEYFRIWIANLALTLVTLGIYSPWAKVRRLRYFYGSTRLAGHGFAFTGDPIRILKGRLIALAVFGVFAVVWYLMPQYRPGILLLGLTLFPAILVAAMSFNMRNSAYRNIRFNFVRDFDAGYRQIGIPLAIVAGLATALYLMVDIETIIADAAAREEELTREDMMLSFLMLAALPVAPYLDHARVRFLVDHSGFGTTQARFTGRARSFYWLYAKFFLMMIAAALIGGGIIATMIATSNGTGDEQDAETLARVGLSVMAGIALIYAGMLLAAGYLGARRTNLVYGNMAIGEHRVQSRMRARSVAWLYFTNVIGIGLSLGLLIPWASIRMARYAAQTTCVNGPDLDAFCAGADRERAALGEELVDAFDLDLGL